MAKGYTLASDGTDSFHIFCDLRPRGLTTGEVDEVCDAASISLKEMRPRWSSTLSPGRVCIGAPSMTARRGEVPRRGVPCVGVSPSVLWRTIMTPMGVDADDEVWRSQQSRDVT